MSTNSRHQQLSSGPAVRLGRIIRDIRESYTPTISQVEIAKRAGIDQSYLSLIENGYRTKLSWTVLTRIAAALGVPASRLLDAVLDNRNDQEEGELDMEYLFTIGWQLLPHDRALLIADQIQRELESMEQPRLLTQG